MNYSTASERVNNTTVSSISYDDLLEQYTSLKNQHEQILKQFDLSQQELHDVKRSNQSSQELKEHLSSEIEALQKTESKLKHEYANKIQILQEEIEQLRDEKWKESESFTNKIDSLENQIAKLKDEERNIASDKSFHQPDNVKASDELRKYEDEITSLKMTILEHKKELSDYSNLNQLNKEEIESLQEQNECLKSNLNNKKDELVSVTDMLHSAQEDLITASAELQQFKNQTNAHAVKGNSLFAEVDDKRQEMLKSLSQMKDKVYQLNHEVVSKQAEIDSLLCEKKALWEQYGQSNHHDSVLNRAYERRITDLEKQNDQLQREIARWFEKHLDPASSQAAQWLSGVMEYYREENQRLNNELAACSVDNLSKEQKLREIQRHMVTWRTKAMEANASISQLETKLLLAEKLDKTNIIPADDKSLLMQNCTVRQDNSYPTPTPRKIDMSSLKLSSFNGNSNNDQTNVNENCDSSLKSDDIVSNNGAKRIIKKTTFQ